MKAYAFLFLAIIFEVIGTLLLPATQNFSKSIPTIALTTAYLLSFYMLTFAINKLPLTVVYGTWSGLGIFLIAIFSYLFYKQTLSWQAMIGLVLIIVGVIVVNAYK